MDIFLKYRFKKAFSMRYVMFFPIFIIIISAFSFIPPSSERKTGQNQNFTSTDKNNIKSVNIYKSGFELSDPVILFNSGEQLILSFDDLDDQLKNYKYLIQHCDANWQVSDLNYTEYIDGFPQDQISDYSFSSNTTTPYIHYELVFPTNYLKLRKSGNYLIKVFEDDENEIAFTRKFKLLDSKVKIEGEVRQPVSMQSKGSKQEIGFKIILGNLHIPNPETSVKVVIQQNHGTHQIIKDIRIVRNQGSILDYYFNNKSIFSGGNEFRFVNIKSLKYKAENVNNIEYLRDGFHVVMQKDYIRSHKNYVFENDINGKKLIKTEDADNSATEADYAWVHFTLQPDLSIIQKDIFINGEITEGLASGLSKMNYNPQTNLFEGRLFLKQGYYDYQYVTSDALSFGDNMLNTEGSHYETNNEYSIFVYYREAGTFYDQLIGYGTILGPTN